QVGYGITPTDGQNSKRNKVTVTIDTVYSNLLYHDQSDGKGTCSGDSGGPTIYNGKVVGVTSFGDQNCQYDGYDGRVQYVYNSFIAPYINAPITETCDTCFDEQVNTQGGQCYDEVQACLADTACKALNDCLNACGANDQTCVNTCASQHQAGINKYNAIFDCFCGACSSLCTQQCADPSTSASTGSGLSTSANGAGGGSANGSGGASASGSGGASNASGGDSETDGGSTTSCNCSTPGSAGGTTSGALGLAGVALAFGAMRRRRRG
ncbi:MAG TPA: trypsin-like serine protease, partial [Polyangiaceae bacterium]|nr:trypsin-like serine protease [Polyangiaceae bacterium]